MVSGITHTLFITLLALQPYLTRPNVDFDLVIESLKDQGSWMLLKEGTESYYFQPGTSMAAYLPPYQKGQWFYTDYGWTWKGAHPTSWALDHYGYWSKISNENSWDWTPGKHWLPCTVEWLQSGDYFGWRASQLDRFSNPIENESLRYRNPGEWNFLHRDKMSAPFGPEDLASAELVTELMAEAVPIDHIYKSYRDIPRPGPDPRILSSAPEELPVIPVTMSLPELRHKPVGDEVTRYYVYRPEFYQDSEGIMRRIHLFLNPRTVPTEAEVAEMFELSEEDKKKQLEAAQKQNKRLEKQRAHWESLYD